MIFCSFTDNEKRIPRFQIVPSKYGYRTSGVSYSESLQLVLPLDMHLIVTTFDAHGYTGGITQTNLLSHALLMAVRYSP